MQLKIAMVSGLVSALGAKIETASNVGLSGVGLFHQKSAMDLQFNKIVQGTGIVTLAAVSNVITIAVDVGATANKIVQLDGSARIPAVNGSLITNLTAANITGSGTLPLTTLNLASGQFYIGNGSNNPTTIAKSAIVLSGFGVPTSDIDIGARKFYTSASTWASNELVPKSYVDAVAQGTIYKASAKVASTANINLSSPGATIGGIAMTVDDRVLIKDQTNSEENGVYLWKGNSLPMVRSADCDSEADLIYMAIYIEGGTHAYQAWRLLTDAPIVVNTTDLTFSQISGAGEISAGNGISKVGLTLSVRGDNTTIGIVNSDVAVLSSSTTGQVLRSTGSTAQAAAWGALDLSNSSAVTGTLAVARGGTGITSLAQHSILGAVSAANTYEGVLLYTNNVLGRKSSNIVALGKADLREIVSLRPLVDAALCVAGNMKLITLSQTPDDVSKVLLWFNGVMLLYNTHYTISGTDVNATNALNANYGGTGSDGLGFANTDRVIAFYTY